MFSGIEENIGDKLRERKLTIGVAESCSGGLISHRITSVPGCSDYYEGSVISYSNEVKKGILGVKETTLAGFGAVSSECAQEMAEGVRSVLGTDIGLSVTGIAGPGGATPDKPVGLVYIGLASEDGTNCSKFTFDADREGNKKRSADEALKMLYEYLRQ
ncbi:MAG: CinA family protein [Halobacteriota archaeon]|nr:CinA family protein [Halobacteriota archaeon]